MFSQTIEWDAGAIIGAAITGAFIAAQIWFIGKYVFALGHLGMLF